MISLSACLTWIRFGAERLHEAWTTQPMMLLERQTRRRSPRRDRPSAAASPSTNHQGTPLSIGMIIVSGPISGLSSRPGGQGRRLHRDDHDILITSVARSRARSTAATNSSPFSSDEALRRARAQRLAARQHADSAGRRWRASPRPSRRSLPLRRRKCSWARRWATKRSLGKGPPNDLPPIV